MQYSPTVNGIHLMTVLSSSSRIIAHVPNAPSSAYDEWNALYMFDRFITRAILRSTSSSHALIGPYSSTFISVISSLNHIRDGLVSPPCIPEARMFRYCCGDGSTRARSLRPPLLFFSASNLPPFVLMYFPICFHSLIHDA